MGWLSLRRSDLCVCSPVGLTLPFFSYGGSSVITSYAAMGIVAGIKMRPKPESFRYSY